MLIRSYLLLGAAYASASNLFITDYDGHLTSVKLSSESSDVYQLNKTIAYGECGANPTWSTVDIGRGVLYCLDEGFANDNAGALTSFSIKRDGQLAKVHHFNGLNAPVSAVVVGEPAEQQALVSANYGGEGGGSVSYFNLQCNGDFTFNDEIKFKHTLQPGQDEERQAASHPHQAIVDPTGQYVLVPDLGMDLVHIFGWDFTNHKLKQLKSLEVLEGTGPRHAAFWNPSGVACETCPTYFYLVSELAGTVTSYQVSYLHNGSGLTFRQVQISRTTGPHFVKQRTAPAEIVISPDNRFLIVSNRNDSSTYTSIPPPIPGGGFQSDSLATFELLPDGNLKWRQLWPAGGSFPRQFSLNKFGNLVAVGLQYTKRVVIYSRDVATGLIGEPVAHLDRLGNVTSVVWA